MKGDMVNVRQIVKDYLIKNKFDGIWNAEIPCGCEINDLMPCEDWGIDICEPGYKIPCPESCGCGGFHIAEKNKEK